jgi:predicted metal-binding membrane protein
MLETALRHERVILAAALAAVSAFAWAYLLWLYFHMGMTGSHGMSGMDMSDMPDMLAAGVRPWHAVDFALTFAMWLVMMVAMMTPSAAPMILIYANVGRQAATQGKRFAAAGWFFAGYLFTWLVFAIVATAAQFALAQAALLDANTAISSRTLNGAVLIAAGLYEWTALKNACLAQCQSPLVFIQQHGGFRRDAAGALLLGSRHGLYCVGCCWILMTLLFVGGVMNVLWIVALSAFVLVEKLLPRGRLFPRIAGLAFVAGGVWLIAT